MGRFLSDGQIAAYRADGCLHPLTIISEDEAAAYRQRLEDAEAQHGKLHYRTKPYLFFRAAAELCRHPALLDAVEDVLGPDVLLWDSAFVIKEARDVRFVSWHQDLTYWGLESDQVVSAWLALSPSTTESGCMRMVPGSHTDGMRRHEDTRADDNILHRGQTLADPVDETGAVDVELRPGQVSLHHGWVMHSSTANRSDDRRIGLVVNYLAPSVRQTRSDKETATLVRGEDRFGHFRPEPECRSDFAPEAVAFQKEVERIKHEVYDGG